MRNHFTSQSGWRDASRSLTPAFPLISHERRERLGDVRFYRVGKGATAAWEAARRTEARRERAKREAWERYNRALEDELTTVEEIRGGHPILAKVVFLMLFGVVLALAAQAVPWAAVGSFLTSLLNGT
jgi:hypothetical protein